MKLLRFLTVLPVLAFLVACSSSDGGGTAQTAAGLAFKAANTAVEDLSNLSPAPVSAMTLVEISPRATGLTAIWNSTSLGFNDERQDPSVQTSLKEYMGIQFQEDAARPNGSAINVFGRLRNASSIMCIFANAISATSSASLVATGTATITFSAGLKSLMVSQCGFTTADTADLPESATLVFTTPSSTTLFDVKISIDFDGENEVMYAKWGASDGNIAFSSGEDNSNGRTRTLVAYNSVTGVLRGEYLSKSKIDGFGMTIHRLYKNETTGQARVFTVWNGNYSDATSDTSPSDSLKYIVDGNTDDTHTHLSLGISFSGYGSGNGTYEACIQKSDGTSVDVGSVTANAFTCSSTGGAGGKATGYETFSSVFTTASVGVSPTWHDMTSAPNLSWTDSDNMLTSGL